MAMVKKVLIVDDEPDIRTSIKQIVELEGFEAEAVGSGKEALAALKRGKFDLVLMDIFMPEMSGRDAVEKIRADPKLRKQKVAFLTVAKLSEAGSGIIKKLEPVAYLQKPVGITGFGRKLKELLR
jgi:CheY-like chemotaxis protein